MSVFHIPRISTEPPPGPVDVVSYSHSSAARLAIVCPMANEVHTAEQFVTDLLQEARGFREVRVFIVVDNVSRDGTLEILRAYAQREPRVRLIWAPENRNIVDAYLRGYEQALATGFEWVLEIDGGYSHQPTDLARFVAKMECGEWDAIFGSRFCRGGQIEDSSVFRKMISWAGTWMSNALLGTRLHDMTSGFQMFRRDALIAVLNRGIKARAHFFQTEMKVRCRNMRICEVPITYRSASPNVNLASIIDALSRLCSLSLERVRGTL
jgi:dolichol-phosphate mannosyltransferase